jgi:hypothetical protein
MIAGEEENVVCHLVSINKMQQQRLSDAKDELGFFFSNKTNDISNCFHLYYIWKMTDISHIYRESYWMLLISAMYERAAETRIEMFSWWSYLVRIIFLFLWLFILWHYYSYYISYLLTCLLLFRILTFSISCTFMTILFRSYFHLYYH